MSDHQDYFGLKRMAEVSERFQSYNVEMVEVTGGRFWRPYGESSQAGGAGESAPGGTALGASTAADDDAAASPASDGGPRDTPVGMDPALYEYRPPLDLAHPRLRALAAALGPSYVRVSGTWANSVYVPAGEDTAAEPPPGFASVLSPQHWRGVVDFSAATDAEIVTSMAVSEGTRGPDGAWRPDQFQALLDLTAAAGGSIAAAEYMNEPNLPLMGGAPVGYDAPDYASDFRAFREYARRQAPDMLVVGPSAVGESAGPGRLLDYGSAGFLPTRDLLQAGGADVDVFTYHHYGAVSQRCAGTGPTARTTSREAALSEEWLAATDDTLAFYRELRDEFAPGRPLWLTETGESACGGNPWAATFLDTFRYVDQLGRLARAGVEVVMHNTLAASDYALLEETDFRPRPSFWAALLWRRLMGTTVLDASPLTRPGLHVYAHELRGRPGGVALLLINTGSGGVQSVTLPVESPPAGAERYTLSAARLEAREVSLNGSPLRLSDDDALPDLVGEPLKATAPTFAPHTISFLALP